MKFDVILKEEIDSTNAFVNEMYLANNALDGLVVRALFQTDGKGLQRNTWHSSKAQNLLVSIGLNLDFIQPEDQFVITKAVSLALLETLRMYIKEPSDLAIKWPNDLYWRNNKLAGILIKNMISGNKMDYSIIGIGLNVNEKIFPSTIPNPISMSQIVGNDLDCEQILNELLIHLQSNFSQLKRNIKALDQKYLQNLLYFQQMADYYHDGKVIKAKIENVTSYGHLLLKTQENKLISCDLKEVEFIHQSQ